MVPFAVNPIDCLNIYFEDDGGDKPPVLFYYGLMDPVAAARSLKLAAALGEEFRLIFPDHRGHGRSGKPHDVAAYTLPLQVADAVAVLDGLAIGRAHFAGVSWGARLGFALGELAPARLSSLVLIGNQPYEWDRSWPLVTALSAGMALAGSKSMAALLDWFEKLAGRPLAEPARSWLLDNDPVAIEAAWAAALDGGAAASDLRSWRTPTLVVAGDRDDLHDNASQAAQEIPGARFISLPGLDHLTSLDALDLFLPEVLALLRRTA